MTRITFVAHSGLRTELEVRPGTSLMRAAVEEGVDGIVAVCGGHLSCATCHVYVADAWIDRLPPPGEEEKAMIQCAYEAQPDSRLSCQITVTDDVDGLVVSLPSRQQ